MSYIPKTNTQKKQFDNLNILLNQYNSILIGNYDKITLLDDITFICGKCKNETKKLFKQIKVSGALCKNCTYAQANEKRITTIRTKHNVNNISQLESIKKKKSTTATNNGYIKTYDEWIKDIEKTKLNTVWEYCFNTILGYDAPHRMKHKHCGIISYKSPRHHLNNDNVETDGQGCIHCYHNSRRYTKKELANLCIIRHENRFKGYEL